VTSTTESQIKYLTSQEIIQQKSTSCLWIQTARKEYYCII